MNKAMAYVRVALALALLYMVYKETGPFTTLAIGLSMLVGEVLVRLIRALRAGL